MYTDNSNPFYGFQLNTDDIPIANERRVRIAIEGDYKWGSGWTSSQEKRFEEEVYPRLRKAGYSIKEPKNRDSCPDLVSPYANNHLKLYMHPMEFVGYANEDDIKKISGILSECKDVIYKVSIDTKQEVYDLSDRQYKDLILSHSREITNIIRDCYLKQGESVLWDIGFEFARECRIPRLGDKSGMSSGDIDIETVQTIAQIAKELGYLNNKEVSKEQENTEEDKDL